MGPGKFGLSLPQPTHATMVLTPISLCRSVMARFKTAKILLTLDGGSRPPEDTEVDNYTRCSL